MELNKHKLAGLRVSGTTTISATAERIKTTGKHINAADIAFMRPLSLVVNVPVFSVCCCL